MIHTISTKFSKIVTSLLKVGGWLFPDSKTMGLTILHKRCSI